MDYPYFKLEFDGPNAIITFEEGTPAPLMELVKRHVFEHIQNRPASDRLSEEGRSIIHHLLVSLATRGLLVRTDLGWMFNEEGTKRLIEEPYEALWRQRESYYLQGGMLPGTKERRSEKAQDTGSGSSRSDSGDGEGHG